MATIFSNRLALLAVVPFLVACGGGGGTSSSVVPPVPTGPVAPAPAADLLSAPARGTLVAVSFPLRDDAGLDTLIHAQADKASPLYHHFLSPAQFRASYGPDQNAVTTAENYLRAQGFSTQRTSLGLMADGPQSLVESTFHVRMQTVLTKGREAKSVSVAPTVPAPLAQTGAKVAIGSRTKHVDSRRLATTVVDNRYSPSGPYWFTDLKQAYGYPANNVANGAGRSIGIVISSDVLDSDTAAYFGHEKFAPVPMVERHPVLGGPAKAFDPASPDSDEASLDIQQSLGSAPGAKVLLYDIPDLSDTSIVAAYTKVVEDNKADIVSSSFGACELYYTAAYNGGTDFTSLLTQYHNIFRQGNAQGITFVASSGDNGAYECYDPNFTMKIRSGVSHPAADPDVVAVGGTNLVTLNDGKTRNSAYVRESAFADPFDPAQGFAPNDRWGSGGGISTIFQKPWYQELVNTGASMRTIPDISMHMGGCPGGTIQPCNPDDSSAVAVIGGGFALLIGTSASAPELAGLLAVTEGTIGTRLGNANGYIYISALLQGSDAFHNAIPGDNGYPSKRGYNYVVGNGTPKAAAFSLNFESPLAGVPQSPTNP